MLKENSRLTTAEKELATVMNTFFVNIADSLDLKKDYHLLWNPLDSENIINYTKLVKFLWLIKNSFFNSWRKIK